MTPTNRSRTDVVLAVRSDSFSGVERYVCDIAGALHARGWRTGVVGGDPSLMRRQLPDGVRYLPATTTGETVTALTRLGRIGIVHAHMTAAETAAVVTKPLTRARVVSTRHFARPRGSRPAARAALGVLARGIDREVAISRFVAGTTGTDPTVILNGVQTSPQAAGGQRHQVLVMQRLEPEKDTRTALEAWSLSDLAARGWRLVVAGRGSQLAELADLAVQLQIVDSVEFAGFVAEPQALRAASAALLATAPAEPFGLSVVEAMAAGVAVIAARGGAHPETLGEQGRYFAPGAAEECADLLRTLPDDPDGWQAVGEALRRRQQTELTLDRHVDQLERLYQEVL